MSPAQMIFLVFGGMLLMMLFYVLAQFIQLRHAEYGFYAAYIFFVFAYLVVRMAENYDIPLLTQHEGWYVYVNNQLQICAYIMYFPFLSHFLNLKREAPSLHKIFNYVVVSLVVYMAVDAALSITNLFMIKVVFWDVIRLTLAALVVYIAFRVSQLTQPYKIYPIVGGCTFVSFALVAMVVSIWPSLTDDVPEPWSFGLTYYFIGVTIELIFFSLGLGYKRRLDSIEKTEAQEALKLEIEKQKVRELKAMSEVQEQERTRVAKDLHDGLGSMLSGIKMSLSNMKGNAIMTEENFQLFDRSLNMLDNSIRELRRVAHNLMPETLLKFGIVAALKDFTDFVNQSNILKAIFQLVGEERRLNIDAELSIYRLANELINNTLRHASATELIIQLHYEMHSLTLTVQDNGKGFDPTILQKTTGSGWPNIRSRVEYLKGTLDVDTKPGEGTAVTIHIPL